MAEYEIPSRIVLDNAKFIVKAKSAEDAARRVCSGMWDDIRWDKAKLIDAQVTGVPLQVDLNP